ncbi:hypothetical protein vseg_018741 [Gypsophila vaccaria]
MASFYSDAFLYKQPLTTINYSTTISLPTRPKFRLRRLHGRRGRLPTVHLGRKNPRPAGRAGRGFSLSSLLKRARCKWLQLHYSCILKRLRQYYSSMIKDVVEGTCTSRVELYQQSVPSNVGLSFSSLHGGATLTTPKSIII